MVLSIWFQKNSEQVGICYIESWILTFYTSYPLNVEKHPVPFPTNFSSFKLHHNPDHYKLAREIERGRKHNAITKIILNDLEAVEILLTYKLNNESFQGFSVQLWIACCLCARLWRAQWSVRHNLSSEDVYNSVGDTDNKQAMPTKFDVCYNMELVNKHLGGCWWTYFPWRKWHEAENWRMTGI